MLSNIWSTSTARGRRLYRQRWIMASKHVARLVLNRAPEPDSLVDDRDQCECADKVVISWPEKCPRPRVGLVRDRRLSPYWTKYERFLTQNHIAFEYYDPHKSDWLDVVGSFDIVLWTPEGAVAYLLEEIRRKTYILEKIGGKVCFPSFDTLMWNEDKLTQYELLRIHKFPVVETFISHNLSEILSRLPHLEYPLVSKNTTGAGSMSVELVKTNKEAERFARTVFSPIGRMTCWPHTRQKDYVYFQKYQLNEGYDLRVIVIGDKVVGYYRDVDKGDFRASGTHSDRYGPIAEDAMRLARQVAGKFDEVVMAVDMLRDPRDGKFYITELSATMSVDVLGELKIEGVDGIYIVDSTGHFSFEPGKYWTQDLVLCEFLQRKWISRFNRAEPHNSESCNGFNTDRRSPEGVR